MLCKLANLSMNNKKKCLNFGETPSVCLWVMIMIVRNVPRMCFDLKVARRCSCYCHEVSDDCSFRLPDLLEKGVDAPAPSLRGDETSGFFCKWPRAAASMADKTSRLGRTAGWAFGDVTGDG